MCFPAKEQKLQQLQLEMDSAAKEAQKLFTLPARVVSKPSQETLAFLQEAEQKSLNHRKKLLNLAKSRKEKEERQRSARIGSLDSEQSFGFLLNQRTISSTSAEAGGGAGVFIPFVSTTTNSSPKNLKTTKAANALLSIDALQNNEAVLQHDPKRISVFEPPSRVRELDRKLHSQFKEVTKSGDGERKGKYFMFEEQQHELKAQAEQEYQEYSALMSARRKSSVTRAVPKQLMRNYSIDSSASTTTTSGGAKHNFMMSMSGSGPLLTGFSISQNFEAPPPPLFPTLLSKGQTPPPFFQQQELSSKLFLESASLLPPALHERKSVTIANGAGGTRSPSVFVAPTPPPAITTVIGGSGDGPTALSLPLTPMNRQQEQQHQNSNNNNSSSPPNSNNNNAFVASARRRSLRRNTLLASQPANPFQLSKPPLQLAPWSKHQKPSAWTQLTPKTRHLAETAAMKDIENEYLEKQAKKEEEKQKQQQQQGGGAGALVGNKSMRRGASFLKRQNTLTFQL